MKISRVIAPLILSVFISQIVSAAPLYWDPGATGGTSTGGTGNWDTSSALWFNGASDIAWVNANNDDAFFTNTAGTVTLVQSISAGDIYFTNVIGNYLITNATGVETLTLANGTVDTGGSTNTIGAILAGSFTLNKNGAGTLVLSGNNKGFTSPVNVSQGALQTATTNSLGKGTNFVASGASIEFASGGIYTNAFVLSGGGVNNEGALFDATNSTYTATTNYGSVTLETTNVTLGCHIGTLYFEGGISNAVGTNTSLVLNGPGVFRLSNIKTAAPVHLGAGSITINGGQFNVASTSLVYSNLVLNGAQLSSGYTADTAFGTIPSALNPQNITISNGANVLISHTITINANRGIFLGPGGGDIGENTGSGQITIAGPISGPGGLLLETDGSGATVKLGGNNTYSGLTTIQSGAGLIIGGGSTAGTFGTGNVINSGSLTVNRTGTLNYAGGISGSGSVSITSAAASATVRLSGPLSGTGSLALLGAGAIVFAGSNTYSANTLINCQYFMANSTNGSSTSAGTVTVGTTTGGSFLGGTGIISGPVTVVTANSLQPGNPVTGSIGTLTISNLLTLQSGSTTIMNINAAVPASSSVVGLTSVAYGGTLTVNVINGTLAQGQTYQLFGASSYSGTFDGGIQLPTLPSGLFWNTSNLSVNGTISVVGQNGVFNPPVVSGNQLILSGTQGTANGTYSVLSTTDLNVPTSSWNVVSTGNTFDSNGNFSFTNTIDPNAPQEFFMIRQP